ncbi:MAG: sulfur carrier protein ThiS [Desulfovibrionaceae bacterium]|nr:sulfur carrier protein ThiS [Desulfovibrionaceae bacterium]
MKIILNGEEREIQNQSLTNLLQELNLDPKKIVAELNADIVPRDKYDQTFLKENDRLELVQFVGGG